MKLVIVSKDLGGGAVAAPVARIALDRGDEVVVVAEGLAPRVFAKLGVPLFFQGTPNCREYPFSLNMINLLEKVKPDVVLVTLGSPINLELLAGVIANQLGVPLVFIEDCHGAYVRTSVVPNFVITLDDYAAKLVSMRHPQTPIAVVGHPGVPTDDEVILIADQYLADLKTTGARVYAFVGGDPGATDEQLVLLVGCLQRTTGKWCLIPRFHPKWVGVSDPVSGRTYGEIWRGLLEPIADYLEPDKVGDGRKLVASADVAVADYSTLLTTAACCGKTSIFLQTPMVLESMKKNTGLGVFPLVEMGCAHLVTLPRDLSLLTPPTVERLSKLKPYDPLRAYELLRAFVGE